MREGENFRRSAAIGEKNCKRRQTGKRCFRQIKRVPDFAPKSAMRNSDAWKMILLLMIMVFFVGDNLFSLRLRLYSCRGFRNDGPKRADAVPCGPAEKFIRLASLVQRPGRISTGRTRTSIVAWKRLHWTVL